MAETGFGSLTNQTPSRPPSSTVLDAYSTVSTAAHPRLLHLVTTAKPTRAFTPNLSTALRPAHTRNAGSFPVSAPEADYTRRGFSGRPCLAHNRVALIEYIDMISPIRECIGTKALEDCLLDRLIAILVKT